MGKASENKQKRFSDRRELVFLILSGLFLASLTMLNILGTSRFLDISFTIFDINISMPLAIGVLPYPITFLCTDFISELYGQKKANQVVWVGFILNLWVLFIIWLGGILPGIESEQSKAFFVIREMAFGAIFASMIAYLTAQFIDIKLFHFWKKLTKGKHLWLRNNGSTLISQLIDTTSVILITHYYAKAIPIDENKPLYDQLMTFIISGYVFKAVFAAVDTVPFYFGTSYLKRYLNIADNDHTR